MLPKMTRLFSSVALLFATFALHASASPSADPFSAQLPPMGPEALAIVKRMPAEEVEIGANTLEQIKRAQEMLSRDAAISGLVSNPSCTNCFAITFDDGPYYHTLEVAKKIAAQGWKATWFVNGYNWDCIYDSPISDNIRGATADLHMQVGTHSWSHPDMSRLSYHEIDRQIELMEDALLKITGRIPALMRLPYGNGNTTLIDYINRRHGLTVIGWGADTGDTDGATPQQQLNVIRGIKPGSSTILLQHDTKDSTVNHFDRQIEIIKANGWQPENMVTVAHSLGIRAYKVRTSPQQRDSSWTCEGKPKPGQT